jgi:hypothetical protein
MRAALLVSGTILVSTPSWMRFVARRLSARETVGIALPLGPTRWETASRGGRR